MNQNYKNDCPQRLVAFFNYQSNVKNKSELTINEYCLDLRMFFRFIFAKKNSISYSDEEEFNLIDIRMIDDSFYSEITLEDAYEFLAYCKTDRDNHEKARARKVSSIRTFFKYLQMNGVIDDNPMINLDSPKLPKTLPKYLTIDQATKLLESVQGPNKARDYCILTLFLNCGLRLSELVSIDYNTIRTEEDSTTLVITGKGNKQRTIYLNSACVSSIKSYMAVRPKDGVKDKYALFLSNRLSRISPKTVQKMVEEYLDKAGLGGMGFSVHKLRHTAATLMYQTGSVDVLELKEILGHENLNTTQIYTHLNDKELQKAVDSNPLAGLRQQENSQGVDKKSAAD